MWNPVGWGSIVIVREACSKVCSGVQKHPVVTDLANYIVSHQDIQNGVRIHIIPLSMQITVITAACSITLGVAKAFANSIAIKWVMRSSSLNLGSHQICFL